MSQELAPIQDNKRDLPVLADLYKVDDIATLFKTDQFNLLMNQAPEPKWVLENKFAGNSKYIPIGILETLLQRIFKEFRVEVLREGTMFNSVYVTVRLHYLHPISGQWGFHDGVGSAQIQTKSGSSPADLQNINNNAVMMALPMAKSYAIKDASDHFGRLFGRDLNRKDTMGFGVDKNLDTDSKYTELLNLYGEKSDFIPADSFDAITKVVNDKKVKEYDRTIKFLKQLKNE
jgi:hypothetical protein